MAQQFTHTAKPPQIPDIYPEQRWFKRAGFGYPAIHVVRTADEDKAELGTYFYVGDSHVRISTYLTADECEELGRAMLDAAADMRTHSAADLVKAKTEHNPDEVPE
jgi:hypothetical protein